MHLVFVVTTLCLGARGPDITFQHTPPGDTNVAQGFELSGKVTNASEVERVELKWRVNDGTWHTTELELQQSDVYRARLQPEQLTPGFIDYYVIAFDFLGKSYDIYGGSRRAERVKLLGSKAAPAPSAPVVVVTPDPVIDTPSSAPVTSPSGLERRMRFDRAYIVQSGAIDLATLLMLVPELQVSRSINGMYHVATAGRLDDVGARLFIDGVEINGATRGEVDWALPASLIGAVDVTLAGFDATSSSAGLVRIDVQTAQDTVGARALAGGYLSHLSSVGSRTVGTYDFGLNGGGSTGALTLRGRAAAQYTGGAQVTVGEDGLSGTGLSRAPGITRDRALRLGVGGTFEGRIAPGHVLGLDTQLWFLDRDNYAGVFDLFSPNIGQQRADFATQLYAHGGAGRFSYDARLVYQLHTWRAGAELAPPGYATTDVFGQPAVFSDGVLQHEKIDEHVLTARLRTEVQLPATHKLRALFSFDQHIASNYGVERNFGSNMAPSPTLSAQDFPPVQANAQRRSMLTLAAADGFQPTKWLAIDGGVRFSFASDLGLRASDIGQLLTPVASITFKPIEDLSIRFGYDSGVRAASSQERYALQPFEDRGVLGAPSLRYGVQRIAALDVTYAGAIQLFRYLAEVRGFYNGARNQPFIVDDGTGIARLSDGQDVDTFGVSLFGKVSFGQRSFLSAGTSWHRALVKVRGNPTMTQLTDTPQLSAVVSTNIELGRFADLFVSATYYGERRNDVRTTAEQQRAYRIAANTAVNVTVRSMAFYGLRAMLSCNNVFDEERRDPAPRPDRLIGLVPREGLRLLAGLEYAFDAPPAERAP